LKVRDTGETVPSAVLELPKSILTSAVGWPLSLTLNVAFPPASVVVNPVVGLTVIPIGVADNVGAGVAGVGVGSAGVGVGNAGVGVGSAGVGVGNAGVGVGTQVLVSSSAGCWGLVTQSWCRLTQVLVLGQCRCQ
jgi:hypothetical protein